MSVRMFIVRFPIRFPMPGVNAAVRLVQLSRGRLQLRIIIDQAVCCNRSVVVGHLKWSVYIKRRGLD